MRACRQVFAGGTVYAIVRQTDSKVIIGDTFSYVNGSTATTLSWA